jgi:transposase-like protein
MGKPGKADRIIAKAQKRGRWAKFCPVCRSSRIEVNNDLVDLWYKCKKCGFRAGSFPEKAIKSRDRRKDR